MSPSPVIRVSAPARANLIGNPSDLYGGAVLSCSVPLRARVTLTPAEQLELASGAARVSIASAADLEPRGDLFDLARSVLRRIGEAPRCRIAFETDVPMQSGLGGSSALQVALLAALWRREGREEPLHVLAETARSIERSELGIRCGYVDHYMSAFGGLKYVDLRGKERETPADEHPFATVEPLPAVCTPLPFVLAFTGVRHHSGAVHAPIRERWERGEKQVVAAYERMTVLAAAGKRAFLRADWLALGTLMNENHALQQALGGSGEVNDRLISAALAAGAPGAKLAGAGHGGTIVALWPEADTQKLEAALRHAGAASFYRPEPVAGVRAEPA